MIRLLLTINNLNTAGMKFVLSDIVKNIDKSRFEPMIGVNKLSGSALEKEMQAICPVLKLPLRVKFKPLWKFPVRFWKTSRRLKGLADIVHSFDYSSDWTEAWAMKMAGIPFVAEKTNLIYNNKKWAPKLRAATHVICLSREQEKQLIDYGKKVTCIPTGIDLQGFSQALPAKRSDYGLRDDDVVFISVANLVEVKGYEELMEAMVPVVASYPNLRILAIGEGKPSYEVHLKNRLYELKLDNNLVFLGRSDNVPALLKMADVKILSTQNYGRREGFGAAIVEAMACALPVLATRSGGPEDIVVEGQTGWLIPGDGPKYLMEGLNRVMKDRDKWEAFGKAGLERAQEAYNMSLMVKRHEAVYEMVLSGK